MTRAKTPVGASQILAQTGIQLALIGALTDRLDAIIATGGRAEREGARQKAAMLRRILKQLEMVVVLVQARGNPLPPALCEEISKYFRAMIALKCYEARTRSPLSNTEPDK